LGYCLLIWAKGGMMDINKIWIGKKVFVKLKIGRFYSGIIIEVTESAGLFWFLMNDKFNQKVMFVNTEIDSIEEER
jgi:hypothetical protein